MDILFCLYVYIWHIQANTGPIFTKEVNAELISMVGQKVNTTLIHTVLKNALLRDELNSIHQYISIVSRE
jgi:hypothetical protein